MTVYELRTTLEARKKGLAYRLWKTGNLCQLMQKYPQNPEEACPELSKPKKTYQMPDFLKEKWMKQKGLM